MEGINQLLIVLLFALIAVSILASVQATNVTQALAQSSDVPQVKFIPAHRMRTAEKSGPLLPSLPESESRSRALALPPVVNLWSRSGANHIGVDDQGQFGSCTAHAMRYAWRLWRNRLSPSTIPPLPSRCFWYAESRLYLGDRNLSADWGSTNYATVWALANKGMIAESSWPYTQKNIRTIPSAQVRSAALAGRSSISQQLSYYASTQDTITAYRTALSQGKAVIMGIMVYSSFMTSAVMRTGRIPMPRRGERLLGGHAIAITGYDFNRAVFTFRNSWGARVGVNGSFEIPFAYVASPSLSGDAWIV